MSIPLDRLYHFIEDIAQEIFQDRVIIYRFYPHGSKNFMDMKLLNDDSWHDSQIYPNLYCYDQEPLDYEYYKNIDRAPQPPFFVRHPQFIRNSNVYDKVLLLHSEQRSLNLIKYQKDCFVTVYYWSHAVIALDWYRYAQHVTLNRQSKKIFLIYNRAWSGTREYRLRFAELLIQLNLQDSCQTNIKPVEPELDIHYNLHHFKNPAWRPQTVLEDHFPLNTAESHYSADFDISDYENTEIEVVLETLFDDDRLHLTEKSLRPIALGQPFILAATQGSLEYLRSYGFKTFGSVWDESYDTITDPEERLCAITNLIGQIVNTPVEIRERKLTQAREIAEYNRQHFFSSKFFDQVKQELVTNCSLALNELASTKNYQQWLTGWPSDNPDIVNYVKDASQHYNSFRVPNFPAIDAIKSLIKDKLDIN